jgi:thioesterase domain-containing protein
MGGHVQPTELTSYLHDHIPLSAAMGANALAVDADEVLLEAPLAPNINHRDTVFGGSASALAILAAWSLVHVRLASAGHTCRLVIQRNTMEYSAPVPRTFCARARLSDPDAWERFVVTLERRGRARIAVRCILQSEGTECGGFEGTFVAIR